MESLVWAKLKYCYHWPAKITKTPIELGKTPKNKQCVMFFGTKNFGFASRENIVDYVENRAKFTKKKRSKQFDDAVQQMDDYIRDSTMYAPNGNLNPTDTNLHIKQERDFVVKTETDIDDHPFIFEDVRIQDMESQINQLRDEKERIINELVKVKADNQTLNLDNQRQKSDLNSSIKRLEAKLSDLKKKLSTDAELKANYEKTITNLNTEKRELLARLKQVHQSVNQNVVNDLNESDKFNSMKSAVESPDEYEVEFIHGHRTKTEKYTEYLVRWKGYSEEHDTWEKEKNLSNCPKIIKAYLQKKKQKN